MRCERAGKCKYLHVFPCRNVSHAERQRVYNATGGEGGVKNVRCRFQEGKGPCEVWDCRECPVKYLRCNHCNDILQPGNMSRSSCFHLYCKHCEADKIHDEDYVCDPVRRGIDQLGVNGSIRSRVHARFTLVRYTEDDILYVCKSKCVKDGDKGMTLAKYVNGKWFKATVIKEGEEEVLTFIKRQLEYCAVTLTKPATEEFTGAVDNAPESFTGGYADIAPESFSGGSADNAPESFTGRPVDNAPESFSGRSADIATESFTGRPVYNAPESFSGGSADNAPESFNGGSVDNAPESSTGRPVDNAPESSLDFPDASLPFETEYVPDITTASCSQQLDTGFADSLQSSAKDEIEQGSMVSDDRSEPFEDSSDDFVISDDELLYSSTTTSGCNSSGNCSKLTILAGTSTAWSPPILSSTVNDECNFEPLPSVSTIQSVPYLCCFVSKPSTCVEFQVIFAPRNVAAT